MPMPPNTDAPQPNSLPGARRAEALYDDLMADELTPHVAHASLRAARTPCRVDVEFRSGSIPAPVQDIIDHYDADIVDPACLSGDLRVSLIVTEPLADAGTRNVRRWGGSLALTLTDDAKAALAAADGTPVSLSARDGELRVTPR
jgi:hypothetical protein